MWSDNFCQTRFFLFANETPASKMNAAGAMAAIQVIRQNLGKCAKCKKQLVDSKLCSRCKHVSYCCRECQQADWKKHKIVCEPHLPIDKVMRNMVEATAVKDWQGTLKGEWRLDELRGMNNDEEHSWLLAALMTAHQQGRNCAIKWDDRERHALACIRLGKERSELLRTMERFRDQSEVIFILATNHSTVGDRAGAVRCYKEARSIGEKHGFFSAECQSCLGLGEIAILSGDVKDGVDLIRNALAAAPLVEDDDIERVVGSGRGIPTASSKANMWEISALERLIEALFQTATINSGTAERESLIKRYKDAALAHSRSDIRIFNYMHSMVFTALIHEVLHTKHP